MSITLDLQFADLSDEQKKMYDMKELADYFDEIEKKKGEKYAGAILAMHSLALALERLQPGFVFDVTSKDLNLRLTSNALFNLVKAFSHALGIEMMELVDDLEVAFELHIKIRSDFFEAMAKNNKNLH